MQSATSQKPFNTMADSAVLKQGWMLTTSISRFRPETSKQKDWRMPPQRNIESKCSPHGPSQCLAYRDQLSKRLSSLSCDIEKLSLPGEARRTGPLKLGRPEFRALLEKDTSWHWLKLCLLPQDAKAAEFSAFCAQWGGVHGVELARSDSALVRTALLRSRLDDRLKATVAHAHRSASCGLPIRPYTKKVGSQCL